MGAGRPLGSIARIARTGSPGGIEDPWVLIRTKRLERLLLVGYV